LPTIVYSPTDAAPEKNTGKIKNNPYIYNRKVL